MDTNTTLALLGYVWTPTQQLALIRLYVDTNTKTGPIKLCMDIDTTVQCRKSEAGVLCIFHTTGIANSATEDLQNSDVNNQIKQVLPTYAISITTGSV